MEKFSKIFLTLLFGAVVFLIGYGTHNYVSNRSQSEYQDEYSMSDNVSLYDGYYVFTTPEEYVNTYNDLQEYRFIDSVFTSMPVDVGLRVFKTLSATSENNEVNQVQLVREYLLHKYDYDNPKSSTITDSSAPDNPDGEHLQEVLLEETPPNEKLPSDSTPSKTFKQL